MFTMSHPYSTPVRDGALPAVQSVLQAFPVACFSLTLIADIAYWQSSNLLWLHFSEWLLLAGLVAGVPAALVHGFSYLLYRTRYPWLAIAGGIVVLLLAALNSLVHTADGWTAVVPFGLALSALTVAVMILAGWFGRTGVYHDYV